MTKTCFLNLFTCHPELRLFWRLQGRPHHRALPPVQSHRQGALSECSKAGAYQMSAGDVCFQKGPDLWLLQGDVRAQPRGSEVEAAHRSLCPGPLCSLSRELI